MPRQSASTAGPSASHDGQAMSAISDGAPTEREVGVARVRHLDREVQRGHRVHHLVLRIGRAALGHRLAEHEGELGLRDPHDAAAESGSSRPAAPAGP